MSERQTRVRPRNIDAAFKGEGIGLAHYGLETRADMIAAYRKHYQRELEEAQYALALPDDELVVETYRGAWAMRSCKEVTE